jgi:ribosome biogenesis GTP-binding protein YsxC/EngB
LDIRTAVFHRAAYKPADFPRDGRPQFAVVGRSNVGKSSFINTLLGRKSLARVSQTPGKTQAIQFYLINDRFYLVDLPGYGYAKVPRAVVATWGDLIRAYFEQANTLKLVFLLVDARREPTDEDVMMREWMEAALAPGHHQSRQAFEQPACPLPADHRRGYGAGSGPHRVFKNHQTRSGRSKAGDGVTHVSRRTRC